MPAICGWQLWARFRQVSLLTLPGRVLKRAVPRPRPCLEARLLRIRIACLSLPLLLALSPAAAAAADRLITEDGRVIDLVKGRKTEVGYTLTFNAGEILVGPDSGIASIEIEGDMADYVPQNEDEKKKLADGFIRYRGKWMSRTRYESQLNKEFSESQERLTNLTAHSKWHNAWELETKHFKFKTNTSEELLAYYSNLLEAYYALMNKRIGIKPTLSYRRKKMGVNIYKSRKEFMDLAAAAPGPTTLGYFWSGDDTLNFFHDYEEPKLSEWVALHECTHLLTFLIDQQYGPQIWLNEAVADYYGSSKITQGARGTFEIEPGLLQTDRILTVQQAFEDDNYTRLEDLFFVSRESYTGFHYAHGWSLVYFIYNYENGKHAKAFSKFFKDLYTLKKGIPSTSELGPPPTGVRKVVKPSDIRDLLLKTIKYKTVAELEKDWKAFITEIPIESGPALLKRGLSRTRQGKFEGAIEDLDLAIESGITDPRAWTARGIARAMNGSFQDGIKDLEKALKMAPLNAQIHNRLSQLHVGFAAPLGFDFDLDGDYDDEDGKRHAGFAMELDPSNQTYKRWYEQFK
ncbi:MAG: hypothetical protein ACI9F9_001341 [Candidatus Paceibacteria bacterium]|jgi:hypothetical protein